MSMRKRGRWLGTWASAVATGLVFVAWAVSYVRAWRVFVGVEYTSDPRDGDEDWFREFCYVGLSGERGRFVVRWPHGGRELLDESIVRDHVPRKPPPQLYTSSSLGSPCGTTEWTAWKPWNRCVAGVGVFNPATPPCGDAFTCVALPYYLLVPIFAAPSARAGIRRWRLRRAGGCATCGYLLAGLPAGSACPECGRAVESR